MSKITVNNVELELNLLDADVMEIFETLTNEIQEEIKDPQNYAGKSNADSMRFQCRCIEKFLDRLFGEGTSDRVFAGASKNDLGTRMECFGQIMSLSESAINESDEIINKYTNRQQNRQQRRAEQRHGGKPNKNYHIAANQR